MNNIFKKMTALIASSVCMLTFVGLGSHDTVEVANAASNNKIYKLATSVNDIKVGSKIIITNSDMTYAMSTQASKNRKAAGITIKNNEIDVSKLSADVSYFTLKEGSLTGSYGLEPSDSVGKYLYCTGTSDYVLKTGATLKETSSWMISINEKNEAIIESQGGTTNDPNRTIRFYSSNKTKNFAGYVNGTSNGPVHIFYECDITPTTEQQLSFVTTYGEAPQGGSYKYLPELPILADSGNHYFAGWYYNPEFTGNPAEHDQPLYEATTLYAKWEEYKTATFHFEDGVTQDKVIGELKTDDTIDESLIIKPKKQGFRFDDWTIGKGGEKFVFASATEKNPTKIKDTSIDVYANWTEGHKVYYYLTEDAVEPKYTNTVYHGDNAKVHTDPTGLDANQLFLYWYEKGTDGSKEFNFKGTPIMQDTHLVAKIVEKPTITLKSNNETVLDDTALLINQELVITAETTGEASKVVWTIDNAGDAIKVTEEGNKLTISGYKVGEAMITATVTDPLNGVYTDETFVTVSLNEFQKQGINAQYNLGATYTLIDEGLAKLEKVTEITADKPLSGKYVIAHKTSVENEYAVLDSTQLIADDTEIPYKYTTTDILSSQSAIDLSNYSLDISKTENGYIAKTKNGFYLQAVKKHTANETLVNACYLNFEILNGDLLVSGSNNLKLRYNTSSNQFRFYDSDTGKGNFELYKLTGGVQFNVSEARAKFSFDVTDEFIKANNVTEVGVRVGKDIANIDKWEKYNLTSTKNGSTYTVSVKYTNLSDFATNVYVIPYVVIDGKTYDFNTKTDGNSTYYDMSVESVATLYDGLLENPKDQDFITRLLDLIAKNK